MNDLPAIITSTVGALTAAGAAVTWLWNKVEKRFEHIEDELAACRAREAKASKREAVLMIHANKHLAVIELLWQEVERRSRGAQNQVLERARKLLDDLKSEASHD
jgi:hypothetical protein